MPTVEELVDSYLQETNEERVPDGKLHPSQMWLCDRDAVLSALGVKPTRPPDNVTMRRFRIGDVIHEVVQSALSAKYGDAFQPEFDVDDDDLLVGHSDGLLMSDPNDPDSPAEVFEFKSSRNLSRVRKEGKPQEHHAKQAITYAVMIHRKYGHKITGVRIVYFEKNDLNIVEFFLPWTDDWIGMVYGKVEQLRPYIEAPTTPDPVTRTLPPCTCPPWMKAYCQWWPACESNADKFVRVGKAPKSYSW